MTSKVTSRGRVTTIPKAVREVLAVGPGSQVRFRRGAGGCIVIEKADDPGRRRTLADLRGTAGTGWSTDEIMAMIRGDDP